MHSYSSVSDQELILAFKQGEAWSNEELYNRYFKRVADYCTQYLHSYHDGEDIAQEVMCKIILQKKLLNFKGETKLWAWIKRIAINKCSDRFRYKKRTQELRWEGKKDASPLEDLIPAKDPNPEEAASQAEEIAMAETLMAKLAVHYQQAILLTFFLDKSYREAAVSMGVPVNVLGVYRHRGVQYLIRLAKDLIQKDNLSFKNRKPYFTDPTAKLGKAKHLENASYGKY